MVAGGWHALRFRAALASCAGAGGWAVVGGHGGWRVARRRAGGGAHCGRGAGHPAVPGQPPAACHSQVGVPHGRAALCFPAFLYFFSFEVLAALQCLGSRRPPVIHRRAAVLCCYASPFWDGALLLGVFFASHLGSHRPPVAHRQECSAIYICCPGAPFTVLAVLAILQYLGSRRFAHSSQLCRAGCCAFAALLLQQTDVPGCLLGGSARGPVQLHCLPWPDWGFLRWCNPCQPSREPGFEGLGVGTR
jgi:hypothetical protein